MRSPRSPVPWSWGITNRAGGALLIAFIFTLLVRKDLHNPVFALLCVGIASHVVIDYVLWQPTGNTDHMRWPFPDLTEADVKELAEVMDANVAERLVER